VFGDDYWTDSVAAAEKDREIEREKTNNNINSRYRGKQKATVNIFRVLVNIILYAAEKACRKKKNVSMGAGERTTPVAVTTFRNDNAILR